MHPLAVEACRTRNHLPSVHRYPDHLFLVLFSPLMGVAGHIHLLELDVVVGRNFLITVHGPLSPAVQPVEAMKETGAVLERIRDGRVHAETPGLAAHAIGSVISRRQRALLTSVSEKLPALEQKVTAAHLRNPEALLEEMFLVRHELITARTMAAQAHDVFDRALSLEDRMGSLERPLIVDLSEQFDRIRSLADSESHMLFGVIELYQTKVHTKMTVASERLAVIASVTLPITALASVYGMNSIVNDSTQPLQVAAALTVMALLSGAILRWTKKQGWW